MDNILNYHMTGITEYTSRFHLLDQTTDSAITAQHYFSFFFNYLAAGGQLKINIPGSLLKKATSYIRAHYKEQIKSSAM